MTAAYDPLAGHTLGCDALRVGDPCSCGAVPRRKVDPPGTCHLVGCPGKGVHPPHGVPGGIGAGTTPPPPLTPVRSVIVPADRVVMPRADVEELLSAVQRVACGRVEDVWDGLVPVVQRLQAALKASP